MSIVITGACGFIGKNLVKSLNEDGFTDIVIIDRINSIPRLESLKYAEFLTPDLFRIHKGDVLVHLGATTSTTSSDQWEMLTNNFVYSTNIIKQAYEHNCRVIYASTAGVYGNGTDFTDQDDYDHVRLMNPITEYAKSKQLLDMWNLHKGKKAVGLRFFNVWGNYEQHKGPMESLVSKKFNEIKAGIPQKLYFHPTQMLARDFIYAKDVVKIIKKFITSDVTGLYNVGTGIALSWHELLTNYFEVFGNHAIIDPIEFPKDREENYQFYTKADTTKLLQLDFMKDYEFYHVYDALKDFVHDREHCTP